MAVTSQLVDSSWSVLNRSNRLSRARKRWRAKKSQRHLAASKSLPRSEMRPYPNATGGCPIQEEHSRTEIGSRLRNHISVAKVGHTYETVEAHRSQANGIGPAKAFCQLS